jgi:hypothetical protein
MCTYESCARDTCPYMGGTRVRDGTMAEGGFGPFSFHDFWLD